MSLKAKVANFTGKSPVDAVMSVFTKTIEDLDAVALQQMDIARKNEDQANAAMLVAKKARGESRRAGNLKDKLEELVNV